MVVNRRTAPSSTLWPAGDWNPSGRWRQGLRPAWCVESAPRGGLSQEGSNCSRRSNGWGIGRCINISSSSNYHRRRRGRRREDLFLLQDINYVGGRSIQREQDRMMVLELRHVEALAEFMVNQALIIRDQRHDRDDGELTHIGMAHNPLDCP